MYRKIKSYKISLINLSINVSAFVLAYIYCLIMQSAYNDDYFILNDKDFRTFYSFLGLSFTIYLFVRILITLLPLIRYLFKRPKIYIGEIYSVKTVSQGILNRVYNFYIQIKYDNKVYTVYKICTIIGKDSEINYGDCEELLKGKKVKFYISLFNKNKALIKKIIE